MKKKDKISLKNVFRNIKKTVVYIKSQKKYLTIFMISIISLTIISTITPMITAKIILNLTGGMLEQLLKMACLLFCLEIVRNICRYFINFSNQRFFRKTILALQVDIAESMQN